MITLSPRVIEYLLVRKLLIPGVIYSDGLIQFWTKGNMDYLESIGFGKRLCRAEGETNLGNRYKNKVVGDSPEVNVGTDNDGFKDFGVSMAFHVGLSFLYDLNEKRIRCT